MGAVRAWLAARQQRRDAAVLDAVRRGVRHGYDICKATRMRPGTVYPSLARLEAAGLVESWWDETWEPRRRAYRVTT